MNVSITDRLAGYVRKKLKSGRYNNVSEVVREALRRMEDEDACAVRLAKPTAEDILTDLTEEQLDGIRRRVRAGIESIVAGKYTEYDGREGLKELADGVKAGGGSCLPGSTPGGNALSGLRNYGGRSRRVFFYWAKRASPEIADRIIDKFTDRFWLLGEHPDAGKASEGIAAGVKCHPAGKYLIHYRATRRGTDILHVFHGARHQRKAFKKARETR